VNANAAPGTVTTAQADWILFNRVELRGLAEAIMPKTSTSIVAFGVTGGADESPIETTAIERAQITYVLDEADKAIRDRCAGWRDRKRRKMFLRIVALWYDEWKTWREIDQAIYYTQVHCRRFRGMARQAVKERLASLPGTAMKDFWKAARTHTLGHVETNINERLAEASLAGRTGQKARAKMITFGGVSEVTR